VRASPSSSHHQPGTTSEPNPAAVAGAAVIQVRIAAVVFVVQQLHIGEDLSDPGG